MIFISHRGNLDSIEPQLENSPDYINNAICQNFYVEIDLWVVNNNLFLGHDEAHYKIDIDFLNNKFLYVHCKNKEALHFMNLANLTCDYFWHQEDNYTLTSKGKIWVHQNSESLPNSIVVLNKNSLDVKPFMHCYGICSDFIKRLKNEA